MTPRVHTALLSTVAVTLILASSLPGAYAQTDEERRLEALKAIPYVSWTQSPVDEADHGVTLYDSLRAFDGYTLYAGRSHATLVDMRGVPVHSWTNPDLKEWEHAEMTEDGDLYVVLQRRGVYRLGWSGEVVWSCEAPVHHDFDVEPDGSVLAIAYDDVEIPEIGPDAVTSDRIVRLGPGGAVTDVWKLSEHRLELLTWCSREALTSMPADVPDGDWSHMNTLELIRDPRPGPTGPRMVGDAFRPGNVLVSIRNLDLVGVVDLSSGEFVWGWGPGELDHPHQPTMLPNGNILVFDNGYFRGWSRVVEYDPLAETIVWEYRAPGGSSFFSRGRGAC
jgi:hypothetical protein